MDEYACKILNVIQTFNEYRFFSNSIINQGIDYYKRGFVHNVKVISDNEIQGKVKGNGEFDVTIKLLDNKSIRTDCTCKSNSSCKHVYAVINYIKENLYILDFEYQSQIHVDKFKFVKKLFSSIKNINSNFYISDFDKNQSAKLYNILQDNLLYLIDEKDNEETYQLTLEIILYFNALITNQDNKARLEKLFNLLVFASNSNFINTWVRFVKNNAEFLEKMTPIIKESRLYLKDQQQSRGLCKLIDATVDNVVIKHVKMTFDNNEDLIENLIFIKLECLRQYEDEEVYMSYFEQMSPNRENVENSYLLKLAYNFQDEKINSYISKNKNIYTTGQILSLLIQYKNNFILIKELFSSLTSLFTNECKLVDFIIIHRYLPSNTFNEIKEKLLKIAKKTDKSEYLEMEIYLDKETGYEMAKEYGIIEFNKHVGHFLAEKENELIFYYQEQLINFFSKNKGMGVKFYEVIKAVDTLLNMKNGKYYIFSIYRTAKDSYTSYDTGEALDFLNTYVMRLGL